MEKNVWKQALLNEIAEYDIISFDIFDTLIMRKTFEPHDVFRIVERRAAREKIPVEDFYENRIKAELELIAAIPTIYELYDALQRLTGITDETRDRLCRMELDTERGVIVRRDEMCSVLKCAADVGKRIYLVSDMYIPTRILREWLEELGIKEFDDLFVSCEFHKPKVDGLFDIFRGNISGRKYLHIGDNPIYDGKYALQAGLTPYIVKSAKKLFEDSPIYSGFSENIHTFTDRLVVGQFIARIFNSPFMDEDSERLPIAQIEDYVYAVAAPVISGFTMWLLERMREGRHDGLLLAARDGYLIDRLLDACKAAPPHIYFHTSRIACNSVGISDYASYRESLRRPAEKIPADVVRERLGLCVDRDMTADEIYATYQDDIFYVSQNLEAGYGAYLRSRNIRKGREYLFMDFVSSGTCQKLLIQNMGLQLEGVFFYRYDPALPDRTQLHIESYLNERQGRIFWKYYKFFETIMSSPEPTFLRVSERGELIFEEEKRTEEELSLMESMQDSVVSFYEDMLFMQADSAVTIDLLIAMTELMDGDFLVNTDRRSDTLYLYDSYEGGTIKVL